MTVVIPNSPQKTASPDPMAARRDLELRAHAAHQAVFVGNDTVLCRVLSKFMCYVDSRDRALAPHLIMNGFWEPWITLAIGQRLRRGMVCVDVGANLGYFTLLMADLVGPEGAVVAFEPNPRLAELCKSSLYVNGFRERVCLSTHAASDRDGEEMQLDFDQAFPMNGTLVASTGATSNTNAPTVRTVRLDSACAGLSRIDLIKIDVEGAEEAVWDGMQALLDKHPGVCLVLEWNAMRRNATRLLDKIQQRFAVLRHIDFAGQVEQVTREQLLTERGSEDWMLLLQND